MPYRYSLVSTGVLLQEQASSFQWTYIWLAAGGLVLALAILAFAYLLVRRRWDGLSRLLQHPVLHRADQKLSEHVPRLWGHIRRRFTVHQWHGLALTVAGVVTFAALYLFALITESWTEEDALYAFDQRIYGWLVASMNQQMTSFMHVVTHFGDGLTVTLVSLMLGGFLLLRRYRWEVVSLFLSVGVGSAVMWGLKWVFERSRPGEQLARAAGHSFPSGHSFMAMTLYGFLIYLTWRFAKHDAVRVGVTVLLTLLIFLVGLSRVILRVHWVSDVAGGFTVGLAWLVCSLVLTRALQTYSAGRVHTEASKALSEAPANEPPYSPDDVQKR